MIRHIVLFSLREDAAKAATMAAFKAAIEALPAQITDIRFTAAVHLNANPDEAYDLALVCEFATLGDLRHYAAHSLHVKAAQIIALLKTSRACVDYDCAE
jgi:hypothetical protein